MKTYIKPSIKDTSIKIQPLMAGSFKGVSGLEDVQTSTEDFDPTKTVDSRKFNVWGGDEEE